MSVQAYLHAIAEAMAAHACLLHAPELCLDPEAEACLLEQPFGIWILKLAAETACQLLTRQHLRSDCNVSSCAAAGLVLPAAC